ncbi:MAG TPA: PBP1A family penicillin-binding protein [Candidatus Saccharimonadales bacterium]|nr:PBP1A family penicillin-binding protein [Candidatus Saccharimonadales bacterium]
MRIRIGRGKWVPRLSLFIFGAALLVLLVAIGIGTYYWVSFGRMIDQRLSGHIQQTTARIYAAPMRIYTGEALTVADMANHLQRAGYSELDVSGTPGRYVLHGNEIEIRPSVDSYFGAKNKLVVDFSKAGIEKIRSMDTGGAMDSAEVEPELLTSLFDNTREKRRAISYNDIPRVLRDAVLSVEDRRFFEHPGFDPVRILGAAWADLRHGARVQGGSTISMQVARSFFFNTDRTIRRKIAETVVALELEHRFTKQQIFELYANEIYLGNRGSFAIHGFGEASLAYFNKDLREVNLQEAAFLAGIIHAPNRYSGSERRPERAVEARDRALLAMTENKAITAEQAQTAKKIPLQIVGSGLEGSTAPYFVDMVKDHLLDRFSEADLLSQSFRVYTTLDPELQRAASEAIDIGVKNIDGQLAHRYAKWRKEGQPAPQAQVAMVVLDPHTGEIKALIGGRDYGESQLNHILSRRQPGSAFKPFVYAAAFQGAVDGVQPIITPATTVMDEPTTFDFDGKEYTPNNYGEKFHGQVTVREALTYSLNVATVKVAELVGYTRVTDMAHEFGLDPSIQPTPSVALGAYEMTPLEVATGYTILANDGVRTEPMFLRNVVNSKGESLEENAIRSRRALDPRVAYLVTSMMEDVINHGTGATVRARGFTAPAAGKTGTSRDGWFAGYTSNLLAIVWVGFDDNRDLGLSGANAPAPIWAEFMKRAVALPAYRDVKPFEMPEGVIKVTIDPESMALATPECPTTREEVYIHGTEPTEFCPLHGGHMANDTAPGSWLSHVFGGDKTKSGDASPAQPGSHPPNPPASADNQQPEEENKKGVLRRIFGIFGGKKDADKSQSGQ